MIWHSESWISKRGTDGQRLLRPFLERCCEGREFNFCSVYVATTNLLSVRRHMLPPSDLKIVPRCGRLLARADKCERFMSTWRERQRQKIQTSSQLVLVGADGISKRSSKEKTTDIKRVVVMGIIMKGADGLGRMSEAGRLFLDLLQHTLTFLKHILQLRQNIHQRPWLAIGRWPGRAVKPGDLVIGARAQLFVNVHPGGEDAATPAH